jgi:hypothetical protein
MRRITLSVSIVFAVAVAAPATPVAADAAVDLQLLGTDVLSSANVTYHGTIPLDSPAVGGEVVVREDLGGKRFFYVTGLQGLSIYDITAPATPILAGHLPFPHSQNEDVKASDDGRTIIIAADGSLAVPVNPVTTGITVVDVSNPLVPRIVASSNDRVMGRGTNAGISEHTAECANADCTIIYGRTGRIYRVNALFGRVDEIGRWNLDMNGETVGGIHALNRDETGLIISDSNPRLILDPGVLTPGASPEHPVVLAQGAPSAADDRLQHNNVRVGADAWVARHPTKKADRVRFATAGVDFQMDPRAISALDVRPIMRAGELVVGNTESNLNPGCSAAGGLSTWSIVNFDKANVSEIQQLEVFRPLNGTWLEGDPAANALGCSGHWFTVAEDGLVAASWYEHGVRFFDVDETYGTIRQVGYFQPVATEAGAAYWIDDTYVYAVDYARGIDILSFDRGAAEPGQAELDASWAANLGIVGLAAEQERFLCREAALAVG